MRNGRLAAEGSIGEILDKYRVNTIELAVAEPDEQTERLLRESAFAKNVSFYAAAQRYVIDVEDEDRGMAELLRLLADNNIPVKSLKASRPTLEQVYLDLVSGN